MKRPRPGGLAFLASVWRRRGSSTRHAWRRLRKGMLAVFLALALLAAASGEFRPSAIDLAVAPHKFSIVGWQAKQLPGKLVYNLKDSLPVGEQPDRAQELARVQEFFLMGQELARLDRELVYPESSGRTSAAPAREATLVGEEMARLEAERRRMQAQVAATLEREVAAVLAQEGLSSSIGVFPPVSTVLTTSPHVLVLSPRDRIARQQDILLNPGLSSADKAELEDLVLREEDLSALVVDVGGVALYPSLVVDSGGLHWAVETVTHEWLHHWLFFRPLGLAFWSSPEMTSLNETVATIAGEELGDLVYANLTGEVVDRTPRPPQARDPAAFDFRAEMRETRLRAEELLAQGRIEEAEAYMEERRQVFVANGYLLRKLNQAYFAFHGTYATGPASVSPIGDQVKELRARSESLAHFLNTVARFGSYEEFVEYLEGEG